MEKTQGSLVVRLLLTSILFASTKSEIEVPRIKCCLASPANSMAVYTADQPVEFDLEEFPECDNSVENWSCDITTYSKERRCFEILYVQRPESRKIVHCRSEEIGDRNETLLDSSQYPADIRRCCLPNNIFDRESRTCVPARDNQSDIEPFLSLMPKGLKSIDPLIVVRGNPECEGLPIFDYEVDYRDVSFNNASSSLKVKVPSSKDDSRKEILTLTADNGCMELTEDALSRGKLLVRICRERSLCDHRFCLRKCCLEGTDMSKCEKPNGTSVNFHQELLNVSEYKNFTIPENYGIIVSSLTCKPFAVYPYENWTITPEGWVDHNDYDIYHLDQYCMDMYKPKYSEQPRTIYPFACFPEEDYSFSENRYKMNNILQIISCFFMIITLIVYIILPSQRNHHGKTLMCHVASLLLAFICLASMPWITPCYTFWGERRNCESDSSGQLICMCIGYTMLFAFVAAFSWLNVMCFDMWWTFGGIRGTTMKVKYQDARKKFLYYCLYSWGFALLLTVCTYIVDYMRILPNYLLPNMAKRNCWFSNDNGLYGEMLFFTGPVAIQLTTNVILFISTTSYCNKVKAEIKKVIINDQDPRNKRYHADRHKHILNIKLFLAMGIPWIMEVISFFIIKYGKMIPFREEIFYVTDILNCLQGVMVFILFVMKKRIYKALLKRFGLADEKKTSKNSGTTMQDPSNMKKSESNATLTSTYTISVSN